MAKADDIPFRYSFRAARRIAKALNLKEDDRPAKVLRGIETAISVYVGVYDAESTQPTSAKVRDSLTALEKRAADLLDAMEGGRPGFDSIALEICPDGRVECLTQQIAWLERLQSDLSRLRAITHTAVTTADGAEKKARSGRRRNHALAWLIQELGNVYREYAGHGPLDDLNRDGRAQRYSGGFYEFLRTCMAPIGRKYYHSEFALGEAAERALKAAKNGDAEQNPPR